MEWTFDCEDRGAAQEVRRAFVDSLVAAGANEAVLADAQAVFAELLGNVVRHAGGACEVVLEMEGPRVVLSVLDRGRGFSPTSQLPADALSESGRGLFIVRTLAADFNAMRRPGGGTHARAVLHLDEAKPKHCNGTRSAKA